MSRIIVPISLGGSDHQGVFCPPVWEMFLESTIPELIRNYQNRLGRVDEVGFFHGGEVSSKAIALCAGLDWRLSVHPLDFTKEHATRYISSGMKTLELEVLSLCDDILAENKRGYTFSFVEQQIQFCKCNGISVGLVLSPGLSRSTFAHCVQSVQRCINLGIDFVRIYPICVYKNTQLERWYKEGRYTPLTLPETVTIVREMMDLLSEANIEVIRVGRQHAHDGLVEAVAGPIHSNIRSLVEHRRFFDKMAAQLCAPDAEYSEVLVNPKDIGLAKGVQGSNIRHLRARLGRDVRLEVDDNVPRGCVYLRRKDERQ